MNERVQTGLEEEKLKYKRKIENIMKGSLRIYKTSFYICMIYQKRQNMFTCVMY